jgi:hypothetical protein
MRNGSLIAALAAVFSLSGPALAQDAELAGLPSRAVHPLMFSGR